MNTEHGEIIIYEAEGGKSSLEVHLHEETVWLSLNQLTELFDRDKSVISRHLNNIFKSGELRRDSVVAKNATTAADGKIYQVDYFNLDAIISVERTIGDRPRLQEKNRGLSPVAAVEF